MNKIPFRYYLITDRTACAPRLLTEVVERACKGGIKAVQLREKDLSALELYKLAKKLRKITARYDSLLFINDRVDVAMAVDADGVHCRETSLSPETIHQLDEHLLVGSSVHSLERAQQAACEGADFLQYGPVFYTSSKAKYGEPQGIPALHEITHNVDCPVLAVGGISIEQAQKCLDAGAYGLAGISSIMKSSSPQKIATKWKNIFRSYE